MLSDASAPQRRVGTGPTRAQLYVPLRQHERE